ncbi:MAG: hypothetical protein AAF438_23235, partial [Pseudomonadota bacterium]
MARTLQDAKYKLKTSLGVSENFYSHCTVYPIYGTGQGSGNSPAIWCFISNTLFDCFEERAHGATFESPNRRLSIKIYMIGFVDDTTGQVNEFNKNDQSDPTAVITKMQEDAQLWNDLLWSSGGALELTKCSYHVYFYKFTRSSEPVLVCGQVGNPIRVSSGDRTREYPIPHKSAYTAHKTLGHHKDPSGNQTGQYRALKEKIHEFRALLACSPLDRSEAWLLYYAVFLPSIGYVLPNCFFSKQQLERLQAPVMTSFFKACGFNSQTAHVILYGPTALGGAGFRPLFVEQGIGQVLSFLRHWRQDTQASTLLRIAVSWAQYAVGTGRFFLQDVGTPLPHLEACWLASLRRFLAHIQGGFEVDDPSILPLQRQHDVYLMDDIIRSNRFTNAEIKQLNYCRMFLQVLTLADLTDASGNVIDSTKITGDPSLMSSRTSLHHVHQEKPTEPAWALWKQACSLWCNSDGSLRNPLGMWLVTGPDLRMQWRAYFAESSSSLYVRIDNGFQIYFTEGSDTVGDYETDTILPRDAVPADVTSNDNGWRFKVTGLPTNIPSPCLQSWASYRNSLPTWIRELLHTITFRVPLAEVVYQLTTNPILSVSDGSVKANSQGAFGWIMSTAEGHRLIEGAGPASGFAISSYRAEGYGM